MFYRLSLIIYSALTAGGLMWLLQGQVQASPQSSSPQSPVAIQNLVVSEDGVSFTLHTAGYTLTAAGALHIEGLETWQAPGEPLVPVYQTWLAVPAGAEVEVVVRPLGLRYEQVLGVQATGAGIPISDPNAELAQEASLIGLTTAPSTLATAVDHAGFFPTLSYQLSEVQHSRDVSVVSLALYPLQYHPATQQVRHNQELAVEVRFTPHSALNTQHSPLTPNQAQWTERVLNPSHIGTGGGGLGTDSLIPNDDVRLPVGETAYKISVREDGVHEVTYAQLAILGLAGNINPANLEMMHDGRTVAHQHLDANSNNLFDMGDAIRFYGWAFDGSRFEQFYATENVFWLWVTGTADPISTASATPSGGAGTAVTTTQTHLRFGEEKIFWFSTLYVDAWANMPNDPDYFFWRRIYPDYREDHTLVTLTLPITLPYASPISDPALFTAELHTLAFYNTGNKTNTVNIDVNGLRLGVQANLEVRENGNAVVAVPQTDLASNGLNTITLRAPEANLPGPDNSSTVCNFNIHDCVLLNEVRVSYVRDLRTDDDQLQFASSATGLLDFTVDNFSTNEVLLWDISDRYQPVRLTGGTVTGAENTLAFSRNQTAAGQFIALTEGRVLPTTGRVSSYEVADLTPAAGADWLAISHSAFLAEAQRLGTHRTADGYTTAVLDVQDIINQYGYGHPSPTGIHAYLQEAVTTWDNPPRYVALMGTADYNPRLLPCYPICASGQADFSILNSQQVPTYFTFRDRFQGLAPSDYEYSLLVGSDKLPDVAIGRLPAHTLAQAHEMVDKIILYENNQLTLAQWQRNVALLHDNTDAGGDFLQGVTNMANYVPPSYPTHIFGLTLSDGSQTVAVRQSLTETIAANISMLAYRGHGSVDRWADEGLFTATDANDTSFISNQNRPFVSLSLDCLDGHFTFPGWQSLSEAFMVQDGGRGSAAHWSSSGLGYDFEHTVLANGLFGGIFDLGYTALGDAINHSKSVYAGLPFLSTSELYTFILQGDPAMQLYRPEWNITIFPPSTSLPAGTAFEMELALHNTGLYPSKPIVTYTVPAHVGYISHTATLTHTFDITTTAENELQLTFNFANAVAYGGSVVIALQLEMVDGGTGLSTAEVSGTGWDMSPNTGRVTTALLSARGNIYLPFVQK